MVLVPALIMETTPNAIPSQTYVFHLGVVTTYSEGYHFSACVIDGAGAPVAGALVTISFETAGNSTPVATVSGHSDPAGMVNLSMNISAGTYVAAFSASSEHSDFGFTLPLPFPRPGQAIYGPGLIAAVAPGNFSITPYVAVSVPTQTGVPPFGLSLTYEVNGTTGGGNVSGKLGAITSVPQLFRFPVMPALNGNTPVALDIVNTSGGVLYSYTLPLADLTPTYGQHQYAGGLLLAWIQGEEFAALAGGAVVGYVVYGRDRISGAIDPVLSMPLSRRRVVLSRLVSGVLVLAIGSVAAVLWIMVNLAYYSSITTPLPIVAGAVFGALLAGTAMLALTVLLSRFTRSHMTLLGGSFLVAAAASIVWTNLTTLVGSWLGVTASEMADPSWQGNAGLLSPGMAMTNPIGWGIIANAPDGSQFVPTASVGLAAIALAAWILLPMLGIVWAADHLD
jgi:ABC-type transport system involved in multi-copper enzyme maturation permease subunit